MMSKDEKPAGFAEQPQAAYDTELRELLLREPPHYEKLRLGDGGRVVIPAAMREEMGVKPGDTLIADVKDGELRLISRRMALRQAQAKLSGYRKPGESVVEEFLAERRAMWGEE